MPSHSRLVTAAMSLRGFAPEIWAEFVRSVQEYAAATTADMVRCPPELLVRAQGMAIMANEIVNILTNAPQLHEQAQTSKAKKQNG